VITPSNYGANRHIGRETRSDDNEAVTAPGVMKPEMVKRYNETGPPRGDIARALTPENASTNSMRITT
jgi:hypothetical protein